MFKFKHYILFFTIILLNLASLNFVFAFESNAPYALLMDYSTGTILYEKNAREPMIPSSMTKIMTSYIVFKHLKDGSIKLTDEYSVSEEAWKTEGTKMFVPVNSKVKLEDLLRGVIVQSGNDACKVLAEGIYGDEATFVEKMNEVAKSLNMANTSFKNSSGLPDQEHFTSAYDLALLAIATIKEFPEYYAYFAEKEFKYNNINQYNRNILIGKSGVDGLKTGHTESGGYGIVVSAAKENNRLIAVINGLESEKQRADEAMKLINYGFSNYTHKKLFNANAQIIELPIWYGEKERVGVTAPEDIEVVLQKSALNTNHKIKVVYNSPIKAPISKGQTLAKIIVEQNGNALLSKDLIASENVNKGNLYQRFLTNIKFYLNIK